jgi:RND family efflux transporter MFP subunit
MPIDKAALDQLRIDRGADEARGRNPIAIGAVVLAVAAAAVLAIFLTRPRAKAVKVAPAVAIQAGTRAASLNASGYVTARRQATVSSKVTGKVIEVNVEEGMHVKAGQVLARLDGGRASSTLQLARAQQSAAASALEETRVRIAQAQIEYNRASRLSSDQIASRADLDRARAELDALRARLAAQQEAYAVAGRQVQLQNQDVEDTVIRAPFDGVVVSKDAQPGEMISPISAGSSFTRTGICTIVDMDSLEIEVDINEAYINRVRANQRVEAVLDAYPDWKIPAHVITAVPTADRQKATVRVRIALDVKDTRILPDMGVKTAFIEEASASPAAELIEVPRTAIRREGEQDVVFAFRDGRAERRAVRVVSVEGDHARLSGSIQAGENVIVEGPVDLKDGDRVKPAREKTS